MIATMLTWLFSLAVLGVAAVAGYFAFATRRIAAEAERQVPPVGKFIEVDGNRLHYVEQGEGRPIVFVHGLGAQLHHFRHPLFSAFGQGYRLIALDRPGSGYSTRAPGATGRLTEQALLVRHFIEALGLEKPLVVGHSLGGAITLALALDHPEAISGIALLAPLTHLETELRPEFRSLYVKSAPVRKLLAHTVAVPAALKFSPQTLAFIFGPQEPPADYRTAGGGYAGLRPSHFFATATDLVAIEHDLGEIEKRYGELTMPAGLFAGTADRVLNFKVHHAPMPERIKGLDFEYVEGLGHMPQYAETARVVAFIRRMADKAFASADADRVAAQ